MSTRQYVGQIPTKVIVTAETTEKITWTCPFDGVKLEAVYCVIDSILQSKGKLTLRVNNWVVSDASDIISVAYGFTIENMSTDIPKGATVEFEVYNTDTVNDGEMQLQVNAYKVLA